MHRSEKITELMQQLNLLNQLFQNKMGSAQEAEIKKRKGKHQDQNRVWEINCIAWRAAQPELNARDKILEALCDEIGFNQLPSGNEASIDAFIEFLGVDVLAWRCAHLKERGLHVLKRMPLTSRQVARLKELALLQLERRGTSLTEFSRLMIRLADSQWIEALREKSAGIFSN